MKPLRSAVLIILVRQFILIHCIPLPESTLSETIGPTSLAQKLLKHDSDELILIFTGDTQYYFPCTLENDECKAKSASCREKNGLMENDNRINKTGLTHSEVEELELECIKLESHLSNTAQRRSIYDLNRKLANKPKALIINGDLTNFGHTRELIEFKDEWMTLPLRLLVGLGNHDYENNVDDCVKNGCANNMLYWFVRKYAKAANLRLDYTSSGSFLKTTYSGSFAYSETLCTDNGITCVRVIQLNNRPDYTASIDSVNQWEVRSSLHWLRQELEKTDSNKTWPILINLHNLNKSVKSRIKTILTLWMNSEANKNASRKVAVFYAHLHSRHEWKRECIAGASVPFMYVGSVPHNRFSAIKFTDSRADIYFMRSNIENATSTIVDHIDFRWHPC